MKKYYRPCLFVQQGRRIVCKQMDGATEASVSKDQLFQQWLKKAKYYSQDEIEAEIELQHYSVTPEGKRGELVISADSDFPARFIFRKGRSGNLIAGQSVPTSGLPHLYRRSNFKPASDFYLKADENGGEYEFGSHSPSEQMDYKSVVRIVRKFSDEALRKFNAQLLIDALP